MINYDEQLLAVVDRVPTTIPEVLQQQDDLQDLLIERTGRSTGANGLACFNHLYRIITATVLEALEEGRFEHPDFLSILDVEFAKRYFAALGSWLRDPRAAPRSWAVLLDRANHPEISALRFAVAGVNAHVNFDLAFSVVSSFSRLDLPFDEEYRADYRYINDIFEQKIPQLRDELQNAFWTTVDWIFGDLDDRLDDIVVIVSREWAWQAARRIWPGRHDEAVLAKETRQLDRFASLIGRGLLVRI